MTTQIQPLTRPVSSGSLGLGVVAGEGVVHFHARSAAAPRVALWGLDGERLAGIDPDTRFQSDGVDRLIVSVVVYWNGQPDGKPSDEAAVTGQVHAHPAATDLAATWPLSMADSTTSVTTIA